MKKIDYDAHIKSICSEMRDCAVGAISACDLDLRLLRVSRGADTLPPWAMEKVHEARRDIFLKWVENNLKIISVVKR